MTDEPLRRIVESGDVQKQQKPEKKPEVVTEIRQQRPEPKPPKEEKK